MIKITAGQKNTKPLIPLTAYPISSKIYLNQPNLPEVRFHDLRHSHATFLLMQGVPLKVISELMGHSSTNITQDIYSHVLLQMQQQAADAVDDILNEKKRKRILAFILDP